MASLNSMPRRTATGIVLGALALLPVAAIGATGDVARQGLMPGGAAAPTAVEGSAFSPDGRVLLLTSTSALSGASTGGTRQVFSRDMRTGAAIMASSSARGVAANLGVDDDAPARTYGASLGGRYVVFSSTATNLAASDSNGSARDVFRKDTLTGRVVIVSRDSRGNQPAGGVVGQPSISADGTRVAFTSGAAPLVPADTNGEPDIYVADLRARSLTLVSRTAAGAQSAGPVGNPAISADGQSVAFDGDDRASVLAPGDADGQGDVYVARPGSRAIVVASVPAPGGADAGPSDLPAISGDGSRVAFRSQSALVPGSGAGAFVRDLDSGVTRRASVGDISGAPAITVDGSRVAFAEQVGGQVWVRALESGALYRASRLPDGGDTPEPSTRPAISGATGVAAFTYSAGNPLRADTWTTDIGGAAAGAPDLTARAISNGRRVTVTGTAASPAGVAAVMVGRRTARIGPGGRYAVSFVARLGTDEVVVRATSGAGAASTRSVDVVRGARRRGVSPTAPRPRALRVTVKRPWARATFRLPVRAAWRVELRRRTPGPARAGAFRLISHRSGRARTGRIGTRLRIPRKTRPGSYQVRVLISSSRGLGTTARTIRVP